MAPSAMDISRDEKHNPHQSFGAGGPHYCLGHILGREVLKAQMREIYHRMPNLEVGEPDLLLPVTAMLPPLVLKPPPATRTDPLASVL